MESGIQLMFDLSEVITFHEQTAGASVRPVRTSQSPGSAKDLTETGAHSSERCFEFLASLKKNIDPNGLSTRMLRECLAATEGGTSSQLSLKWSNWGTMSNGSCLTQRISEYRKTGSESILLGILEAEVNAKYFLSKEQTEKIVFQSR